MRIIIDLIQVNKFEWALFGPNSNQISGVFRGDDIHALEWAEKWITSWYNWSVRYDQQGDKYNECKQENRFL